MMMKYVDFHASFCFCFFLVYYCNYLSLSQEIILYCIKSNSFEYLSLILKYMEKNKHCIENGINFEEYGSKSEPCPPLITLLKSDFINQEWLTLYFELSNQADVLVYEETLKDAIKLCDEMKLDSSYKSMIKEYMNKHSIDDGE